ncbi:hypothetical protein OAQ43_03355 [Alphaproteobacteria bacterium]|nr:hypothetical protein [Alphaproteobacteria bacterium]
MNNILKKIAIRCDGASLPEIGTGHIIRMKILIKELINSDIINKNKIFFVLRKKNQFKIGYQLIKSNYSFSKTDDENIRPNSIKEANYLIDEKFDLVIFDRLNVHLKIIKKLKEHNVKTIIFDNKSYGYERCDLAINAIFDNVKNYKNVKIGYKYLILASAKYNKYKILNKNIKNNISIYFGGYDHRKLFYYILPIIKLDLNDYIINIIIPKVSDKQLSIYKTYIFKELKLKKNNIRIYHNNYNFYKIISSSTFVIISGGLIIYDCVFLKIPSITIPQYKHQTENISKFSKEQLTISGVREFKLNKAFTSKKIKYMLKNIKKIKINLKKNNKIDNKGPLRIIKSIKQYIN